MGGIRWIRLAMVSAATAFASVSAFMAIGWVITRADGTPVGLRQYQHALSLALLFAWLPMSVVCGAVVLSAVALRRRAPTQGPLMLLGGAVGGFVLSASTWAWLWNDALDLAAGLVGGVIGVAVGAITWHLAAYVNASAPEAVPATPTAD